MIIWRGFGLLALIIPFALAFLLDLLFNTPWVNGVAAIIGAIINWFLGKTLNEGSGQLVKDEETDKERYVKVQHSLMWIRMEYWSILIGMIGIGIILSEVFGIISKDSMVNLTAVAAMLFLFISNFKYIKVLFSQGFKGMRSLNKSVVKPSVKSTPTISKPSKQAKTISKSMSPEKKAFYEELKNLKDSDLKFDPTDNSRFMPKS